MSRWLIVDLQAGPCPVLHWRGDESSSSAIAIVAEAPLRAPTCMCCSAMWGVTPHLKLQHLHQPQNTSFGRGLQVYYPDVTEILGQPVFRRVADIPEPLDIVDVFRSEPHSTPAVRH